MPVVSGGTYAPGGAMAGAIVPGAAAPGATGATGAA